MTSRAEQLSEATKEVVKVITKTKPVYEDIRFDVGRHESYTSGDEWVGEQAHSCCAVLELGNIDESLNFTNLKVDCECKDNIEAQYGRALPNYGWDHGYYKPGVKCSHPPKEYTEDDLKKAFEKFEEEAKKAFGMIVVYLLPKQDKGWFGRLIRDQEWEDLGKFYNPKTRHTLHHYRKVLRRAPPRRSRRKVKRVFGR